VSWKYFAALPLAAWWLGNPTALPRLREPLAGSCPPCDCASAKRAYLFAYAYAGNEAGPAREFLAEAERKLRPCLADLPEWRLRLREVAERAK
jgi:hypothetical protein